MSAHLPEPPAPPRGRWRDSLTGKEWPVGDPMPKSVRWARRLNNLLWGAIFLIWGGALLMWIVYLGYSVAVLFGGSR